MTQPKLAQFWSDSKEDGRRYKHPHTGDLVPSVTTITGLADKSGLAQYAADRTLRWASENWAWLASNGEESVWRGGRFRWKDHADERANVGNEVHTWIEEWINDGFDYPTLGHDAQQCVDRFHDFRAEHDFQPMFTEVTAWSHKHGYAGTLDWLGYLDGRLVIGDTKTSRKIHDEHKLQLAALRKADVLMIEAEDGTWSEVEMPEVEGSVILQLRPDEFDPLYRRDERSFYHVEILEEDEIGSHFAEFLAYRAIWGEREVRKALRKEREAATIVNAAEDAGEDEES